MSRHTSTSLESRLSDDLPINLGRGFNVGASCNSSRSVDTTKVIEVSTWEHHVIAASLLILCPNEVIEISTWEHLVIVADLLILCLTQVIEVSKWDHFVIAAGLLIPCPTQLIEISK